MHPLLFRPPDTGLLAEVMDAHGGFALWKRANHVRAVMSTGGLLFRMRTTASFSRTELIVHVHTPKVEMRDFPKKGHTGHFETNRVWITNEGGEVVDDRMNPRVFFSDMTRQLHWDSLDIVYFSGYAVWNYLTMPHLLCADGVSVSEEDSWEEIGEQWRRLNAVFPADVPTHCREQVFYYDENGWLRRHDYRADVIGSYATAAHYCDDHVQRGSIVYPTRRRVVPRGPRNRGMPFPTLVWIQVHEAELVTD